MGQDSRDYEAVLVMPAALSLPDYEAVLDKIKKCIHSLGAID
jgi:hypothetical protein